MEESAADERPRAWDRDTLRESDWLVPLSARLDDLTARLLSCLYESPGLAVLPGLELAGLGDEECAQLCRRFVSLVGTPRPLESVAAGDHLLTATGLSGAVDAAALAPHTDRAGPPGPPAVLALLCVRPAPEGGASLLVSGDSVRARLAADRPEVLPTLHQDFHFGAERNLTRTGPVFSWTADRIDGQNHGRSDGRPQDRLDGRLNGRPQDRLDGRLQVQYNRFQIERGHQAAGDPLTPAQLAALDAFDDVLDDTTLFLRLSLRRGDLLLLNNNTVLHGRTAYTEHPDPLRRRCLTRAWAD